MALRIYGIDEIADVPALNDKQYTLTYNRFDAAKNAWAIIDLAAKGFSADIESILATDIDGSPAGNVYAGDNLRSAIENFYTQVRVANKVIEPIETIESTILPQDNSEYKNLYGSVKLRFPNHAWSKSKTFTMWEGLDTVEGASIDQVSDKETEGFFYNALQVYRVNSESFNSNTLVEFKMLSYELEDGENGMEAYKPSELTLDEVQNTLNYNANTVRNVIILARANISRMNRNMRRVKNMAATLGITLD